jgi:drug/metabolite transporter (DMT)-like permease
MTVLGALASLCLKRASGFKSLKQLLLNFNFYLGGGLYFICALINIYVLKYLDYSTVLPLTSITYIWTIVLSYFVLKEKIGLRKIVGITGIIIGAFLIAI